jgi:hypothetical protein
VLKGVSGLWTEIEGRNVLFFDDVIGEWTLTIQTTAVSFEITESGEVQKQLDHSSYQILLSLK